MAADSARLTLHLLYHEIRTAPSRYAYVLTVEEFEAHLTAITSLLQTPAPHLQPAITFDDGHVSNLEFAAPSLQKFGLHARFFITAGWTGKRAGYMSPTELRTLRAADQIVGAHGLTHTLLTHCTDTQLQQELSLSRTILEDALGEPVTSMSLPGGRFDRRVLEACKEAGYTSIYTSQPRPTPLAGETVIGRLNIRQGLSPASLLALFEPGSASLARLARSQSLKETAQGFLGDRLYARLWALLNRQGDAERDPGETAP